MVAGKGFRRMSRLTVAGGQHGALSGSNGDARKPRARSRAKKQGAGRTRGRLPDRSTVELLDEEFNGQDNTVDAFLRAAAPKPSPPRPAAHGPLRPAVPPD